ncbi:MAG: nitrous oxide reductase family maturation protein NosD [Candidatus Thorarchaeota archaeon]
MRKYPIITLLLLGSIIILSQSVTDWPSEPDLKAAFAESALPHEPILITTETNFSDYGFAGIGTEEQPYLISGLEIISSGEPCISITGSFNSYYIIEDCIISGTTDLNGGVHLQAGNGTISNLEISDCDIGIRIVGNNKSVIGSHISNTASSGLRIEGCSDITVMDVVVGASVEDMDAGIAIDDSENILIENTDVLITGTVRIHGLRARNTEGLTLTNCHIIESYDQGLPMQGIKIDSCSDIVFDTSTFANIDINLAEVDGLSIQSSHFENCVLGEWGYGVCQIQENFFNSSNVMVKESYHSATNVRSNSMLNTYFRVNDNSSLVADNTIDSTEDIPYGIYVEDHAYNVEVVNNTVTGFVAGILLKCKDSVIRNNTVAENQIGIDVRETGANNRICYNYLYTNDLNARDDGSSNIWDDGTSLGNYWDDLPAGAETYQISGSAGAVDRYPVRLASSSTFEMNPIPIVLAIASMAVVVIVILLKRK